MGMLNSKFSKLTGLLNSKFSKFMGMLNSKFSKCMGLLNSKFSKCINVWVCWIAANLLNLWVCCLSPSVQYSKFSKLVGLLNNTLVTVLKYAIWGERGRRDPEITLYFFLFFIKEDLFCWFTSFFNQLVSSCMFIMKHLYSQQCICYKAIIFSVKYLL